MEKIRMGRVRPLAIKRTANKLMEEFGNLFTSDFEKNKVVVGKLLDVNKKTRNVIAGYITKLVKGERKKEEKNNAKREA